MNYRVTLEPYCFSLLASRAVRTCVLLALLGWLSLSLTAGAQQVTAKGTLDSASATVGDAVFYQVEITGTDQAQEIPRFQVEGLTIQHTSVESGASVTFGNLGLQKTSTVTYSYQITPKRAGTFTIPAVEVRAGGKTVFTDPVILRVAPGTSATRPAGTDGVGFAEIVPEKTTAYVGEAIPVEMRLYVDSKLRFSLEQMPSMEAEAFTKAKFGQARQTQTSRGGRQYDVITVRTAVMPTKAGKLSLGPLEFNYAVQIPRATPRQAPGMGRDPFGGFFNDPFGAFGRLEAKKTVSELAEIDVKPLPTVGRPASFTGAIGDFRLSGEGAPSRVQVGDPLTMRMEIRGTGNFDRVSEPTLAEPDGWRAYPATANFKTDDEFGLKGSKSFEVAVIPEMKKTNMPVFEFSYLDPTTGQYQTVRTKPAPLIVEGEALPPPPPSSENGAASSFGVPAATPVPATPPVLKPTDIIGIRYDLGPVLAAQPLYAQKGFLLGQLLPLGVLAGLVIARCWPDRRSVAAATALRRERDSLLQGWRKEEKSGDFFATGARLFQVDAALRTGQPPEAIDIPALLRLHAPDEKAEATLTEVFERRAHLLYAGAGAAGDEELPREERHRIINALSPLLKKA